MIDEDADAIYIAIERYAHTYVGCSRDLESLKEHCEHEFGERISWEGQGGNITGYRIDKYAGTPIFDIREDHLL